MSKQVNFRLDETLYTMLTTVAKFYEVKQVDLVRNALHRFIETDILKYVHERPESEWTSEEKEIARLFIELCDSDTEMAPARSLFAHKHALDLDNTKI